jgi:putative protein-disulfide isomerase
MSSLIYIADPMCSWCYGFGPEISILSEGLPDIPLNIVVGGLRPFNTKPMDEQLKATLLMHWRHVAERSGLPFSYEALSRPGFVYNTEPACRAVVAARMLAPSAALPVFQAIQHAFYAEGKDVTQGDVLAAVATGALRQTGLTIEAAEFGQTWAAEETIAQTRSDFQQTQRWGIKGFPTLVLERDGSLNLVTHGYTTAAELVDTIQKIIDQGTVPERD